jgi:hypothetical protein
MPTLRMPKFYSYSSRLHGMVLENKEKFLRFEVFLVVKMSIVVFWVVTLFRRFERTFRLCPGDSFLRNVGYRITTESHSRVVSILLHIRETQI